MPLLNVTPRGLLAAAERKDAGLPNVDRMYPVQEASKK
jgi:hypothetical protein